MIDVSGKSNSLRYARASGIIRASSETIEKVKKREVPKGDVLEIARIAGISAAKKTDQWVFFCHPIPLDWIDVSFEIRDTEINVVSEVKSIWKTGVEMEALTAVQCALLNIYDMLKPLDKELLITKIELQEKHGGKSDFSFDSVRGLRGAVLVISDSVSRGIKKDKSGIYIFDFLKKYEINPVTIETIPDDIKKISEMLVGFIDKENIDLIITTGGTGIGPRDVTPEATRRVIEKELYGIEEVIRSYGQERTHFSMYSRGVVGVRKNSVIVNLPGSLSGVKDGLNAMFPAILHAFPMLEGKGHDKHEG